MKQVFKGRPPRLNQIFQSDGLPLYFVTINTLDRHPVLACSAVHDAWLKYAERGLGFSVGVGRYVIMPDHIHVFVRIGPDMNLIRWTSGVKRVLGKALDSLNITPIGFNKKGLRSFWQPGFFDHLLRSDESYAEKWNYVRSNPVRAKLVTNADDWIYQGQVVSIDRV